MGIDASTEIEDLCLYIALFGVTLLKYTFYKKLGSGHGTKSFLISHEILSILVLKVS